MKNSIPCLCYLCAPVSTIINAHAHQVFKYYNVLALCSLSDSRKISAPNCRGKGVMKIVKLHNTNQALAGSAITLSGMAMAGTRLTSAEVLASWRPPIANVTALQ